MLKWLCESCNEYRPYTQENCRCTQNSESMFGDNWDEEGPEVTEAIRTRQTNAPRLGSTVLPQNTW